MSCGWTNFCCELPPSSGTQRVEEWINMVCIQVQAHCVLLQRYKENGLLKTEIKVKEWRPLVKIACLFVTMRGVALQTSLVRLRILLSKIQSLHRGLHLSGQVDKWMHVLVVKNLADIHPILTSSQKRDHLKYQAWIATCLACPVELPII